MAVNVGDLIATLGLDLSGFSKGIVQAENEAKGFASDLKAFDEGLAGIKSVATATATALKEIFPGFSKGVSQAEHEAQGFYGNLKEVDKGLGGVKTSSIATGVALGQMFVEGLKKLGEFIVATMELGRQVRLQEAAFAAVTRAVGVSGAAIESALRTSTDSMIDFTRATSGVNRLLLQGFNTTQIAKLGEVATDVALIMGEDVTESFNRVGEAVLRGNTRFLMQAGIIVDAQQAFKDYATAIGTVPEALTEAGKSQALYNATVMASKSTHEAVAGAMDPTITKAKQFAVTWDEARGKIGAAADKIRTALIGLLMDQWPAINDLVTQTVRLLEDLRGAAEKLKPIITDVSSAISAFADRAHDAFAQDIKDLEKLVGLYEKIRNFITGGLPPPSVPIEQPTTLGPAFGGPGFPAYGAPTTTTGTTPGIPPPGQVRVDVAAIAAATQAMTALQHAFDLGAISEAAFRDATAAVQAALTPLAAKFPEVATKLMELQKSWQALDEAILQHRLVENLHDLQQVLKIDPGTISGMERTRQEIEKFLSVATTRPQTEGMKAFIRELEVQEETLKEKIRAATGELVAQDTALGEAGRAATDAGAQFESLTARYDRGGHLLTDYLDDLIELRDRLKDLGVTGPEAAAAFKKIEEAIANTRAQLQGMSEELPGAVEAMRALPIPGRERKDVPILISREGAADEMRRLRELISDRQDFLMNEEPKTAQLVADAKFQIFEAELQLERLTLADSLDAQRELLIANAEYYVRLDELRASASSRMLALELRSQIATAHGALGAWKAFTAGFQLEVLSWGTLMQQFARMGAQTAQIMTGALSDLFFDVITGKLDDLSSIWEHFWQSMLRMILDFLASQAVAALLNFLASLAGGGAGGFSLGGLFGGGGGGAGGVGNAAAGVAAGAAKQAAWNYITTGSVTGAGAGGLGALGFGGGAGVMPGVGMPGFMGAGSAAGAGAAGAGAAGAAGTGAVVVESGAIFATGSAAPVVVSEGAIFSSGAGATGGAAGTGAGAGIASAGAMAAPFAVFAMGLMSAMEKHKTRETRLVGSNIEDLQRLLGGGAKGGTEGPGELARATDDLKVLMEHQGKTGKLLGLEPEEVKQFLRVQTEVIQQGFEQQVSAVMAGKQQFGIPTRNAMVQDPRTGQSDVQDMGIPDVNESLRILQQIEGFRALSTTAQGNLANMGATFAENKDAMIAFVQAVSEQLPNGLALSREQAEQLVAQFSLADEAMGQAVTTTSALREELLGVTNGIGDSATEAARLAQAIVSGEAPADELKSIFLALAREHGPEFVAQLEQAVMNLGLSQEATARLMEMLAAIAETEIIIPVSFDVHGEPGAPGASGGSTKPGTAGSKGVIPSFADMGGGDRQFGLLEGPIPGPMGSPQRITAHAGELVATPNQAAAILKALQGRPEDTALMVEQNKLLREQNRILRGLTTTTRVTGARQA